MTEYALALRFDNDSPEFARGFHMGIIWQTTAVEPGWAGIVHEDNAEMLIRIAEARQMPFRGEPAGPVTLPDGEVVDSGWLHVVIGRPDG